MAETKAPGSPYIDESVLPPDAPPGHEAHQKVKVSNPTSWTDDGRPKSQYIAFNVKKIPFQTTVNACGGSISAALRIGRACYVVLEQTTSKEEASKFRGQCYEKVMAYIKQQEGKNGDEAAKNKGEKAKSDKDVNKTKEAKEGKKAKKEAKQEKKEAKEEKKDEAKQRKKAEDKEDKKDRLKEKKKAEDKEDKQNGLKQKLKKEKEEEEMKEEKREDMKEEAKMEIKEEVKAEIQEKTDQDQVGVAEVKEEPLEADAHVENGATAKPPEKTASAKTRKVGSRAPEAFQSYDVASSGLSEEALRALPPDATEPEVFDAVYRQQWNPGAVGGTLSFDCDGTRFQVTNHAVGLNWYAAFRIARACYVKLKNGTSKDDTLAFRKKCYDDFRAAADIAPDQKTTRGVKRKNEGTETNGKERKAKKEKKKKKKKLKREIKEKKPAEKEGKEDKTNNVKKLSHEKRKASESSTSASASSSSSESESVESDDSPYPWPKQFACAKMLVRSGMRCICHFQINCPKGIRLDAS